MIENVAIQKYNRDKVGEFCEKGACRRFLSPAVLTIKQIPKSSLYSGSLTKPQELVLFKAYHYLKWRYHTNREKKVLELLLYVRSLIYKLNFPLVRFCIGQLSYIGDIDEIRSNGNIALLRAVDSFDPWRGFVFSTYACLTIERGFYRRRRKTHRFESTSINFDELRITNTSALDELEEQDDEVELANRKKLVLSIIDNGVLTDVEKHVIRHRFLVRKNGSKKCFTLDEVGQQLGLCKERIRQIQLESIRKIVLAVAVSPNS
jgi:RNA polymerase sigma factor (sigma-70 family)